MKSIQKRRSLEELAQLFDAFHASKLSMAEFARQRHIPYPTLLHYKNRLLQAGYFQTHENFSSPQTLPAFLQILPSSASPKLLLRCGVFELSIFEEFNPLLLKDVLEVLKHHA